MSVSAFAQGAKGVEGAWRLSEITMSMGKGDMTMKVTQPSMYLFTKTHYTKIYIGTDKPRPVRFPGPCPSGGGGGCRRPALSDRRTGESARLKACRRWP